MDSSFSGLAFLGALAIFMYGIRLSRVGVQLIAGDRLRPLVASLTENRFSALVIGILTTLILQSSTATTVMLVSFAATGVISLVQAMGVILGADIGTTFVVLLFSVRHIADYALLLLVAGVILDIASRRKKSRYLSMIILGFGFVFFGMKLMIQTTAPLQQNHLLTEIFEALGSSPVYAFFAAAAFTALVQNSATTLGVAIALAFSGLLSLPETLPIVLGANVGTCAGSILNSIGGGPAARRVAAAHLLFKATGAAVALAFLPQFRDLVVAIASRMPSFQGNPAAQTALSHLTFNLSLSILFLPFLTPGAWFVRKLIPEPYQSEHKPFGPKYLDSKSLETPPLAFASTRREILRMAEIASEMFARTLTVFADNDRELMNYIEEEDDKVDVLDRSIKMYLAHISQETLTSDQARIQLNLVAMASDMEEICDIINKNVLELAEKKIQKDLQFSAEGWKEIQDFHAKVLENFHLALAYLAAEDEIIARKMARHERHLAVMEDKYREAHLLRLHKGLKEAIETSSIHLDLLANFRRINSKLTAIVKAALPKRENSS
ncbi:MAG TPA: Na/Pi cotransporter family protein [bacterium]|nr:Na/Pi cotransporter family protein [bacterium]